MIGALRGTVLYKKNDSIIILVHGVGYVVHAYPSFISHLALDAEVLVYTYTHVREDLLQLYGFAKTSELTLFEQLLGVSGIGPKTALAIIEFGVEAVYQAISISDVSFFTSIPRLGTKNAQKIIIDLRTKIERMIPESNQTTHEVANALVAMGFSKQEAFNAMKKIPESTISISDQVRIALKILGGGT